MTDLNIHAEQDEAYKARLLKVMRENMALGVSNEPYGAVVNRLVNNKATFLAVYHYSAQ